MAEALSIIGSVGAICNIVDAVTKTVSIVNDLRTRWQDADLTLLSLASQLTALRAALSSIQDWIDNDLRETHHQLVMDLDVSITCCRLLVSKVEGFFSDLGPLVEKPLDLRDKFKAVFGNQGPESAQKLIERQTNALTLLLTACNCKTLAEQKRHLETSKTRKVLDRAKADSVSLYVQRDTASFSSKLTDNLSKISRVFDFDRNIFSSGVYERAFRGSIKHALRQQQQHSEPKSPSASVQYENVFLLGDDEISIDRLVNGICTAHGHNYIEKYWTHYRLELQKTCIRLLCTIIKRGTPDWDTAHVSVLLAYSLEPYDNQPQYSDALDSCAILWWSSVRSMQKPAADAQGCRRERIDLRGMIFYVDIIPAGGLNIYCGNATARLFVQNTEWALPIHQVEPRYNEPSPADHLRATAALHRLRYHKFRVTLDNVEICLNTRSRSEDALILPSFTLLQSALAFCFVFDLKDYGSSITKPLSELLPRLEIALANLANLTNLGAPNELPFVLVFSNLADLETHITDISWPLPNGIIAEDTGAIISHIVSQFRDAVKLPLTHCVLGSYEQPQPQEFLDIIRRIRVQRNPLPTVTKPIDWARKSVRDSTS